MTNSSPMAPAKLNILQAAAAIARRAGASNVTLERVANEAGLSKGGLLYHYPNKRALLEGMLDHSLQQVEAQLDVVESGHPSLSDFVLVDPGQTAEDRAIQQALLAAAAEDPELLAPAKAVLGRWLTQASAHSSQALLVLLASEGVRFLDLLDLLPSAAARSAALETIAAAGRATGEDAA